jgi:hypothetical protein
MKKMRPHWYFVSYVYCPACMRERVDRTRHYELRPKAWDDRHEYIEAYDYCQA